MEIVVTGLSMFNIFTIKHIFTKCCLKNVVIECELEPTCRFQDIIDSGKLSILGNVGWLDELLFISDVILGGQPGPLIKRLEEEYSRLGLHEGNNIHLIGLGRAGFVGLVIIIIFKYFWVFF